MKKSQRIGAGLITIFFATAGTAIFKTSRAESLGNVNATMAPQEDIRLNDYFNYGVRLAAIFNQAGIQTSDDDLKALVNLSKYSLLTPEQLLLLDGYDLLNLNVNAQVFFGVFDRVRNNYDQKVVDYYNSSDKGQALTNVGNAVPYFAENGEFVKTDMDTKFLTMLEQTLRLYPTLPNETKLALANSYADAAINGTPLIDIYGMPTDITVGDLSDTTLISAGSMLPCMSADLLKTGIITEEACANLNNAYTNLFGKGITLIGAALVPYDQIKLK